MKNRLAFLAAPLVLTALLAAPLHGTASAATAPAVAAGSYTSYVLKADGTVWASGQNTYGQLGDGTNVNRSLPAQVPGLRDVIQIAAGQHHALALKSDGTVWTWGWNEYGQLGDGTFYTQTSPVQVANLANVKTIAAGELFSMAIKNDGTVWTWGTNGSNVLGANLQLAKSSVPVQALGLSNIVQVAGGSAHAIALDASGNVYTWGYNASGSLGDGTTNNRPYPTRINTIWSAKSIEAASYSSYILRADGYVMAFGQNQYGELGNGESANRLTPYMVSGVTNATAISVANHNILASTARGELWKWGMGYESILRTPVLQTGITLNASSRIAAASNHNLVLQGDGSVWSWGNNRDGQLGNGTTSANWLPQTTPTAIPNFSAL